MISQKWAKAIQDRENELFWKILHYIRANRLKLKDGGGYTRVPGEVPGLDVSLGGLRAGLTKDADGLSGDKDSGK